MKGIPFTVWILIIIFVVAIYHKGIDPVKDDPLGEGLDTAKDIFDSAKTKLEERSNNSSLIKVNACTVNLDCNSLSECSGGCICQSGDCYKNG